jgi:hypothetical protein
VVSALGLEGAYRGVVPKLIFNIPYGCAIYTTATHNEYSWVCWLAAFAIYPIHAYTSISQLGGNVRLSRNLYRGFLPFAIVNYFCSWKMLGLFPKDKLGDLEKGLKKKAQHEIGHY